MFGLFNRKASKQINQGTALEVDMHSHLLVGLDDGSESLEDSLTMIRKFKSFGYRKLITTPHVMGDFYKNTADDILSSLQQLRTAVKDEGIDIQIEAAAEYYLDEWFTARVEKGEKLLSFGDNYVLVETSYLNVPAQLDDVIFGLRSNGYKPVLAHPERYAYLYRSFEKFQELYEKEVLFQVNINSMTGYYSGMAKKYTEQLIQNKMVDMAGSDCHSIRHINKLEAARESDTYKKLIALPLLNNSL